MPSSIQIEPVIIKCALCFIKFVLYLCVFITFKHEARY